jgi:hypothetical protein
MVAIPTKLDPRWTRALTGPEPKVSSLATKLLLSRLRDDVRRDPTVLTHSVTQLQSFFQANAFAARDLAVL